MSGLKHTFCCFLRRKITFKQEFRQQRSDFRNLNLAPKISLKPAFSMGRFLICAGKATDFENVPRNWHEKFGRSSFAALTSRVFFCSPSGSHFATQKQENSRRRATPGSAIAPLLRNGYAALRIPNAFFIYLSISWDFMEEFTESWYNLLLENQNGRSSRKRQNRIHRCSRKRFCKKIFAFHNTGI